MRLNVFLLFFLLATLVYGQKTLKFTGVVIDQETVEPVDAVYIYNLSQNKSTLSDSLGFFSIEARPGDTLKFQDLRYEVSELIVPMVLSESHYGIIQVLTPNTRILDEVRILSLPSQEEFERTFLSVALPPDANVKSKKVAKDIMATVKEHYHNDRYFYEMWADRRVYELTGKIQPNHIIDPFRWSEFISNLKRK